MNAHSPRMYWRGSPLSRRATASRSQASSRDAFRRNLASRSASSPAAGRRAAESSRLFIFRFRGSRFRRLVAPALRYTDYCVINELEAQQTTGVCLREEDGTLRRENMHSALRALRALGVSTWAVIHCPEAGFGLDEAGAYHEFDSLRLPKGYIRGTVGAGDAFCAGVLHAAESGMSLPEALKLGACTAAASLSTVSASDGVGTRAEVLRLYDLYGKKAENA